jgi:glycolate oxidase
MEDQFGAAGMATMRAIKKALDPNCILNPGKLVGEC